MERSPFLRQIDETLLKSLRYMGGVVVFGFILIGTVDFFFESPFTAWDLICRKLLPTMGSINPALSRVKPVFRGTKRPIM